jgi:predicted anti-sigma-YlaC factor YlaD
VSRCRSYRRIIVASLECEIAPGDALRLARHLETCTACRILMAREARLAAMLDDIDDPVRVDEGFFHAVMEALPERPRVPAQRRWRRGLKLAGSAGILVAGAGVATRVIPSLHVDFGAPPLPRFSPDEADGWLSLFGAAAQWIRVTAQSLAWTGSTEGVGLRTLGVLSLEAAIVGAIAVVAVSGALVVASRAASRAS